MNDDRIEGSATHLNGELKSTVGNLIGDASLESEGLVDKLKGRAQNLYGSATEAASNAYDRIPFEARHNVDRAYEKARSHPAIALAVASGIGLLAFGASHLLMQDKPAAKKKR